MVSHENVPIPFPKRVKPYSAVTPHACTCTMFVLSLRLPNKFIFHFESNFFNDTFIRYKLQILYKVIQHQTLIIIEIVLLINEQIFVLHCDVICERSPIIFHYYCYSLIFGGPWQLIVDGSLQHLS